MAKTHDPHVATQAPSGPRRGSARPRCATFLFLLALLLPVSSCATLLFPERQNEEHSSKLDPNILVLNGIGLLLFVIPGLVAFIVDFTTGAIYLPGELKKGEGPFFWDKGVTPIQDRDDAK